MNIQRLKSIACIAFENILTLGLVSHWLHGHTQTISPLLLCPVSQKDILLAVKANKGQSDSYLMFMFVFFLFQLSCKLSALFLSGVLGLLQVCLHLLHLTQAAPQMTPTWNARTSGTDRRHFTNTHMCTHTHTHTHHLLTYTYMHLYVHTHVCTHTHTHTLTLILAHTTRSSSGPWLPAWTKQVQP